MRGFWIRIGVTFVLFAIGIIIIQCDTGTEPEIEGFEIHEWGVLVGCQSDDTFTATSRPEFISVIREPVIYVHKDDFLPFSLTATFVSGSPTITYPEADTTSTTVTWNDVNIIDENTLRMSASSDFIPLENIIETLNNVDAEMLRYDTVFTRFLFYEGEIPYENKVLVTYDLQAGTATVTNNNDFTVYHIGLVASSVMAAPILPSRLTFADSLEAGESVNLTFGSAVPFSWMDELQSLGFTQMESNSFTILWSDTFLMPGGETDVNLIYRIPQAAYDDLVSLSVDPMPERILRTLYVLVHLSE